jgi:hypothetical protein
VVTRGRREKTEGYSFPMLARRVIFQRAEVHRMEEDGRLGHRVEEIERSLDHALEEMFLAHLDFQSEQRGFPAERGKWDRTKWEKRIVVGQNRDPYKSRYLERAELHKGGYWDDPNFGDEA